MVCSSVYSHAKTGRKSPVHAWLGFGDGNITFQDSLDFDMSEIEMIYADEEEEK